MAKITRDELLKLAQLSHLEISQDEIAPLLEDIDAVLTYAARVTELAAVTVGEPQKLKNVFREDVIRRTDPAPLLAGAPERIHDYFVVPKIIESTE